MIWTDHHGHQWDLDARSPCRRCGQEKPGRFDSACPGRRNHAEGTEARNLFALYALFATSEGTTP